ncbi:MAG: DUF5674 family protein [Patescibacteria group bacterium]
MEIKLVTDSITKAELEELARARFGDMVKAVVDINKGIMAVGGELHADEEALLLEQGSKQENLWGINFYPDNSSGEWIEFNSMINIRPSQGNRSRGVEDESVRKSIREAVEKLVKE